MLQYIYLQSPKWGNHTNGESVNWRIENYHGNKLAKDLGTTYVSINWPVMQYYVSMVCNLVDCGARAYAAVTLTCHMCMQRCVHRIKAARGAGLFLKNL